MFVQDGFLYLIVAKHKLTVYDCATVYEEVYLKVDIVLPWNTCPYGIQTPPPTI
jgi:hypothetical protein